MLPRSFFLSLVEKDFSEFQDFLDQSDDEQVQQLLDELHPADIADIVERLEDQNQSRIMGLLNNARAAEVLSLVEEHHQPDIVEAISEEKLPKIIDEMDSDDATDILEDLPESEAQEILDAMPREESAPVRRLLRYEEDTAGGLMQTELVSVLPEITLTEAADQLREQSKKVNDVQNVYVVNEEGILKGVVPLQKLILEPPQKKISEIMNRDYISIPVDLDQEKVAEMYRKYDLLSAPVVDTKHKLLGRITIDDIVDVIQEEASEDIYRLAGVGIEEHATDSPIKSIRLRLPWLIFNLLTAFLAVLVVSFFQDTINQLVLLAVFMPVVAGMGGNAGTQSLAVITRALALGEVTFNNARKVLIKEIIAVAINGILCGVLAGIVTYFWGHNLILSLVLGVAMICNMFVATLAGASIPLILKWIKVDPALASGVIVTTFTDMVGFFAFLGLAALFIHQMV